MSKEIIEFCDNKIEKRKLPRHKTHLLEDVHIDNILTSYDISLCEINYKCFIGYVNYYYKIKPLPIIVPKRNIYVKSYDIETKGMYFLIKGNDLFKKCNDIWNKISNSLQK